jgi:hypothetical protein
MVRRRLLAAAVFAALLAAVCATADGQKDASVKLFNGKDLTGWKKFVDPKSTADPNQIFTVKDGVIVVDGSVNGYLITDEEYGDYVLRLQWRWGEKIAPKRSRNSGVFVHVTGPNKIWPKAAEAQLMAGNAGDFWLVDGFKLTVDPQRQDKKTPRHYYRIEDPSENRPGEWNQYEIRCKGGTIQLYVNGKLVNEGKNAETTKGKILLQSEGAEIHFRNIELHPAK